MPRLGERLVLVACEGDLTVPPAVAERVKTRVPGAVLRRIPGLGHLGHEEDPALFAGLVLEVARARGLLPAGA